MKRRCVWECDNSILGKLFVGHVSCSSQGIMECRRGMAHGRNNSNGVLGVLCFSGAYRNCLRKSRANAGSASRSETRGANLRRAHDCVGGRPGTRRLRISASIIEPFGCFLGVEGRQNNERLKQGANKRMVAKEKERCITCRPLVSLNDRHSIAVQQRGEGGT